MAPARAGAPIPEIGGAAVTSVAGVVSHITPGVVGISVRGEVREVNPLAQDPLFRQFFNLRDQPIERETEAVGSGVIVDAERGYVLTNSHVVDNATKIEVTTKDNRRFAAKLIGRDTANRHRAVADPGRESDGGADRQFRPLAGRGFCPRRRQSVRHRAKP